MPDPNDVNKDGVVNVLDIIARAQGGVQSATQGMQLSSIAEQAASGGLTRYDTPLADEYDVKYSAPVEMQSSAAEVASLGAMATNLPVPSIPNISNVGSVPFSGSVNQNAIPGGFQPLPQVGGGRKKLYQLSQFHGGMNQKSSPRDISDNECQEATNVTLSNIGRIKPLGDCLNENAIGADISADSISAPMPGYGLFQFTAPADHDGAVVGEHIFTCVSNGDEVDIYNTPNTDGIQTGWINFAGNDNTYNAHIYYSSGNGLYVCDSYFINTNNSNKAKIYVNRADQNGAVSGWVEGSPLIDSPHQEDTTAGEANAVTLYDASSGDSASNANGELIVNICDGGTTSANSGGTGTWNGTYYFYCSYLFDGGVETNLTSLGTVAFEDETCRLNPSLTHTNSNPFGNGDKRVEGARIYFKKAETNERWLLAELSLVDGVKGALDTTFIPWTIGSNVHDLHDDFRLVFSDPPEVYSYSALNGYYANEVYTPSSDDTPDGDGVAPLAVRYKTVTTGQNGLIFIGNVKFDGQHMPDVMMYSMPGKPGVFPKLNRFDSPSSDGSPITALAAFQDTVLQFKQNGLYVINVSNPGQFYAEASFRDCGVFNPCQVFTTSFGVIFVNKHGCFIYDGQKVISLTGGKFDWIVQSLIGGTSPASEDTAGDAGQNFPSVGYDPRSQSIVILKNIGDNTNNATGWVYNMPTQSWTEGASMITNADGRRHTNFIITNDGYLSIKRDNDGTLLNYNHDKVIDTGDQTITYWTKDLDMGFPSQTKFLYKVYITYKGDASDIVVKYGVNGETDSASDLYGFAHDGMHGTAQDSPMQDKSSSENLESWHVRTLYPAVAAQGKDWQSISIYMAGAVSSTFEINDISILYRLRPIK